MSEADKDGRMAQWLSDRLTILRIEMAESISEARRRLDDAVAEREDGDA